MFSPVILFWSNTMGEHTYTSIYICVLKFNSWFPFVSLRLCFFCLGQIDHWFGTFSSQSFLSNSPPTNNAAPSQSGCTIRYHKTTLYHHNAPQIFTMRLHNQSASPAKAAPKTCSTHYTRWRCCFFSFVSMMALECATIFHWISFSRPHCSHLYAK